MRTALGLLFTGIVATLAGCQADHPSLAIASEVAVQKLDAGQHSARFEASVVSKGKDTGLDYAAALLTAGGQACSPRNLQVEDRSPELDQLAVAPPAGKKLTMTVACHHDRLPGHRVATEAEAHAMYADAPAGHSNRMASRSMRQGETRLDTAEGLVGSFVREAYTEECAGQSLLVEKIELASVPLEPSSTPYVETLYGVMSYRCVESATVEAQVAVAATN